MDGLKTRMLKKTLEWGRSDENAKKETLREGKWELSEKKQNESGTEALGGWELDSVWEKRTVLGQRTPETLGKRAKETSEGGLEERLGNSLGKDSKAASKKDVEEKKKSTNRTKRVTWEWRGPPPGEDGDWEWGEEFKDSGLSKQLIKQLGRRERSARKQAEEEEEERNARPRTVEEMEEERRMRKESSKVVENRRGFKGRSNAHRWAKT